MIKTLLITGGTGFIGSHLLERLKEDNYKIIALKLPLSVNKASHLGGRVKFLEVSENGYEEIFKTEKPDCIIHLATYYKKQHEYSDIQPMINSNIVLPVKLAELAVKYEVKYFINTGSFFQYSQDNILISENTPYKPLNLYARTKIFTENFLKDYSEKHKLKVFNPILFSPYGPRDDENKVIPYIINSALKNEKIKLSSGYQKLDFTYVEDIVEAYYLLLKKIHLFNDNFVKFNVGSGKSYSIRDIVGIIEKLLGKNINKEYDENSINRSENYADITLAKNLLAWQPKFDLEKGIEHTLSFTKWKK